MRAPNSAASHSIYQFCDHIDTRLLNKRVLESLIKSGAMDSLGRAALANVRGNRPRHGTAPSAASAKKPAASTDFSAALRPPPLPPKNPLPDLEEWPEHEMLAAEFATVGFYISGHPLSKYASKLAELGAIDLAAVEGRRNGEEITVAGIVVAMRSMRSRKGERWGILTLQDMTGRARSSGVPGIVRASGSGIQEQRAAGSERPRQRGRGWDASRGDGRAAAGRHGAAPSERDARSRGY